MPRQKRKSFPVPGPESRAETRSSTYSPTRRRIAASAMTLFAVQGYFFLFFSCSFYCFGISISSLRIHASILTQTEKLSSKERRKGEDKKRDRVIEELKRRKTKAEINR